MERRIVRILVWIAVAIPLVMDGVYVAMIRSQGQPPDTAIVPIVVASLVVMAGVVAASLAPRLDPIARSVLRAAGAGSLIVFGFLTGFSIGVPILFAGVIAAVATASSMDRSRWLASFASATAAAVVAAAMVLVGVDGEQRIVVCPAQGTYEVEGAGIVLGPYHYRCADGRLEWLSG